MKFLMAAVCCLMFPVPAMALTGVVSKVDVCGSGNVFFRTLSGWYVTARHLGGHPMQEGERVWDKLRTYVIQAIPKTNVQQGRYHIPDIRTNRLDTIRALCGGGFSR